MKRKVIGYVEIPNSMCASCEYRKENHGGINQMECFYCGFRKQRNIPYTVEVPVYEDKKTEL